jgi:site-specific DNA-methyltransferase (adenine-specific)
MLRDLNKIIQGDCLEQLNYIESESVDIVITSPPYNLGNNHHTGSKKHFAYNDDLDESLYQESQIFMLNELYRIVKPNGSLFYNHKNRIKEGLSIIPYEWLFKSKWLIKQELVWFNGSQNFDKIRFYPMTERVYWLVKDAKTTLVNNINHHDLFKWEAEGTNKEHTRSFPEAMVRDILSCFPEAKIILDPYMGSGTVAKVAKENGMNYIGIEISPEYCKIAEDRLRQEVLL